MELGAKLFSLLVGMQAGFSQWMHGIEYISSLRNVWLLHNVWLLESLFLLYSLYDSVPGLLS